MERSIRLYFTPDSGYKVLPSNPYNMYMHNMYNMYNISRFQVRRQTRYNTN